MGSHLCNKCCRKYKRFFFSALLMAFNIRPLVLSGPSGGGKSTIITKAMHDYPHAFALSVSHTTRAPRPGEQNGVHYWFSDKESVEKMIEAGDFLEHASFGGNIYGTSKKAVEDVQKTGRICILDVELQGVRNIKKCHLNAKYILIKAPSLSILEERLRARKTETEESLKKRLKHAEEDLNAVASDPTLFDYIIVNDDLERAYKEFIDAIDAELKLVDNHRLRFRAERRLLKVLYRSATVYLLKCCIFEVTMAKSFSRLPPLPALRDFIHIYKLHAKKILSQNFLMDMNITRKIVRSACISDGDRVVEIGPGPGGITRAILETGCDRLDVIEIDKRFIPPLQHLAEASESRLFIHHGDALKTDVGAIWQASGTSRASWHGPPPCLHVIGNLPFHVASPLIIKYLREMHNRTGPWSYGRVPLTLTFQMEVARRICGPIDSDFRSRENVAFQHFYVFFFSGSCFVPKPKVNVGVVRFIPRIEPLIKSSFEVVEKICRHIFHYRQKFVIRGVRTLYPETLAASLSHELLSTCRIDPSIISIKLGIEQFADMCYVYEKQCERYPGLFLYDCSRPSRTLEELCRLPDALPPAHSFRDLPSAGVSLSRSETIFR
ncbi:unnamed protein product [Toxocara canis]|uniref:Dimethyladenosine transferase 1, mitochondrial n=1 Tax=Toxocara canis TaxID=6265 RepID=A0A3P7GL27_TOXCA|nr:unnamed protein product [Toxocara canis]